MKILHLEDNVRDAALVHDMLTLDWPDCAITVVATRAAFLKELEEGAHDLVLSDFQLPGFNGLEALELTRARAPHVPFIFFSGTIGEERAIEAVRAGAADYVIKDRMQRLPVSIERVLREAGEQRDRRRIEEALAQEQSLLLMLMDNLPDHVYFKDVDSRFLSVSRSLASRFRHSPAGLKGKTDFDVFTDEHARQAFEDEQRIIRTGQPLVDLEEKETWPDGTVTWALTTKLPMLDASGNIVGTFGVSRDITTRKQSEQLIREQADLLNKARDAIIVADAENRITFWNQGAERLLGWTAAEAMGRTLEEVFGLASAQFTELHRSTLKTGGWQGELKATNKAGAPVIMEAHSTLIRDNAGRPKSHFHIITDISENKRLQEQLLRVQRLEGIGMLAAGIAHDLNNVLTPILMAAPMLRLRATDPSDLRLLQTLEHSAERGAGLVRQILAFAHGTAGEPKLMQIKHLARDIVEVIEQTFPKTIRFEQYFLGDTWTIRANPTQIHQVLLNLCVNARDAMPRGGTLSLRTDNRRLEPGQAMAISGARSGAFVVLEVEDTGTGIPPGVLSHIWDPFFTTKGEGKGTGLGLSTVRGIVENHQGFIELQTVAGRGTTFRIFLPAAEAGEADDTLSVPPFLPRGEGELLLLVDDEATNRDVTHATLARYGYRVLAAANGTEAVALFIPRADEIRLVITDLNMPNVDGAALTRILRQLKPSLKVLAISGLSGSPDPRADPPDKFADGYLPKPFKPEALLRKVFELLARPAGT